MDRKDLIKYYVKNYFVVVYDPQKLAIIFCDEFDGVAKNEFSTAEIINIGSFERNTIVLFWGKISEMTGIGYYEKVYYNDTSNFFKQLIKDPKTKEFFKILIKENIPVCLNITEILDEFPLLNLNE